MSEWEEAFERAMKLLDEILARIEETNAMLRGRAMGDREDRVAGLCRWHKKYRLDADCDDCEAARASGDEDYTEGPETVNREHFGMKRHWKGGFRP